MSQLIINYCLGLEHFVNTLTRDQSISKHMYSTNKRNSSQVQQSLDANTQLQFIQQQQQQLALAAMIQAQSATGVGGLIGDYSTTLNTYGIPAFDPSNSGLYDWPFLAMA